ncbi:fused PTS fructose transporter subunit IIA/HPr protein [Vibrio sp. 10N.261.55.A7]|uniref:fused PTS fructose transporter subunit IIA/HPr protein n=1 Tax=Vibrio sp. 10N.261.55.A7 TaxID=1880851 RepID=UPI000C85C440|nr:fused PTS fructose transporter subunit IIA/HPr protein [Vibrio sp. 10N.261.55.A7]PMJ89790.1 bifunctional PTS fructose transporter subunit IIA/HPr protein [Vibrio sp. 10N.261.55.A7]
MLTLTTNDITLNQSFADKTEAIKSIATDLAHKGFVKSGYEAGMLTRESQNSTYLGNGIAIPHGTTQTRHLVTQTGVSLHHFPQGIEWGEGNIVYMAIGIAAQSDEHLGILKQLTNVLSGDEVEDQLKQATSKQQLIDILNGNAQSGLVFTPDLIQLEFPATDMIQLCAVASGLLRNQGCVEAETVADVIAKSPTHLGGGVWLTSSAVAVKKTAMAIVSSAAEFYSNGSPVKILVAISVCNQLHQDALKQLTDLVFNKQQSSLTTMSQSQLLEFFSGSEAQPQAEGSESSAVSDSVDSYSAEFKIKNAHGLHARPGAMLVAEAKKFESTIKVSNLDGDGAQVNAKSLMKVISLGVKHGFTLQFVADGPDAQQAIESIGQAIESGLGEG